MCVLLPWQGDHERAQKVLKEAKISPMSSYQCCVASGKRTDTHYNGENDTDVEGLFI